MFRIAWNKPVDNLTHLTISKAKNFSTESGLSLLVALLEGEVDGGPPPADLLGHLDNGVVGELGLDLHNDLYFIIISLNDELFRIYLVPFLLVEQEVGRHGLLGRVGVLHRLLRPLLHLPAQPLDAVLTGVLLALDECGAEGGDLDRTSRRYPKAAQH